MLKIPAGVLAVLASEKQQLALQRGHVLTQKCGDVTNVHVVEKQNEHYGSSRL